MMLLKEVMKRFASGTTMHGVPKAIQSRSPAIRIIWILLWLLALVMFSVQFSLLITKYYAYPKKVSVTIAPASMPFPEISVCNTRNLDIMVLNKLNRIFKEYNDPLNWTDVSEDPFIDAYLKTVRKFYPLYLRSDIDMKVFQRVLTRSSFATNIDRKLVIGAGVPFHEFIVTCRFGGQNCNRSTDFSAFFDPYYYNCYTYRAPQDLDGYSPEGVENGWSTVVLSGSGMLEKNEELRMIPGTHEGFSPMASSEGVRVVIHPPNTEPYPHTEGFDVPPGYSVSFGVRARQNIRIGPPHGNCSNEDPFGMDKGNYRYRLISCQKKCLQRSVIERCGCKDIHLPDHDKFKEIKFCTDDSNVPDHCHLSGTDECVRKFMLVYDKIACVQEVLTTKSPSRMFLQSCDCPLPCQELVYDVTYSLSRWPADSFDGEEAYIDIFETEEYPSRFSAPEDVEKMKFYSEYFDAANRRKAMKDFARLNVYVADGNVIKTEETEDYTVNELLSDIGGQLALWIGVSVITLAEVLELLINICCVMKKQIPSNNEK